jgi:Domain of unknown function (DUF4399)
MSLIPFRTFSASVAAICLITAGVAAQGTQGQPTAAQATSASATPRTPAPHDAYVYIGWPLDGATVYGTHIKIWFGTRNFGVAPAGVSMRNTGHHHLLIDVPLPPLDQPIPNDRNHLHFGLGQTEAVIELPPGKHTLQLLMGDADHVPHDPPLMSKRITIYVRG